VAPPLAARVVSERLVDQAADERGVDVLRALPAKIRLRGMGNRARVGWVTCGPAARVTGGPVGWVTGGPAARVTGGPWGL